MKTEIKVTQSLASVSMGMQFCIFTPGSEMYENVRVGRTMKIVDDDGKEVQAEIVTRRIDTLYALVSQFGPQELSVHNKPFDAASLADNLEAQFPDNPNAANIGTLYSVVQYRATNVPGQAIAGMAPGTV